MTLPYKDGHIFYRTTGRGPDVVLLHGFLETSLMWQELEKTLSENFTVTVIDLLGHGQTSTISQIHTMEDMANAVAYTLKHLAIERADVIGHSMGGYVTLALLELHPDLVNRIVLMNSTALADSEERKANRDRAIEAIRKNKAVFISMAVTNLFSPDNRKTLKSAIEATKQTALSLSTEGIIAALKGMKVRADRTALLKNTPNKKLLIVGKNDSVLNFNETIKQAQNPTVKLVVFPGGHMSYLENYHSLLDELRIFIEKS